MGFVVSSRGISTDQKKVDAINTWPCLKTVTDLRSFLGLATFYRRFVRGFSSIAAPLSDCLKKGKFNWGPTQQESFDLLKLRLITTPVLAFPNFEKIFELETNACVTGIRALLSQEGRPIAYFGEKLFKARQKWTTYEQEFYATVRACHQWEHYLVQKKFLLHSDHRTLQFINSQKNISRMHARWVMYLQKFSYVFQHKASQNKKVVDALTRHNTLLSMMKSEV